MARTTRVEIVYSEDIFNEQMFLDRILNENFIFDTFHNSEAACIFLARSRSIKNNLKCDVQYVTFVVHIFYPMFYELKT
jgi:hypothetical protein